MKIIIALIIFSLIILIHEFGHFLFAKLNHIVVEEFSLGMGPRLFSFQGKETRYSLKILPLGGSCAMQGEDLEDRRPGSFQSASVWARISVVAAGPVFNFILAFLLSVILVSVIGADIPEVLSVTEGSSAEAAGLQEGDIITEYNGYSVDLGKDIEVYSYLNPEQVGIPVELTVLRDGEEMEISFIPDTVSRYLLGFNKSTDGSLTVASIITGLPLEEAGVQAGDVITAINGTELSSVEDYDAYISENPLSDEEITITYERAGLEYEAIIVPQTYEYVSLGFVYNIWTENVSSSNVVKYAYYDVKYMVRSTLLGLKELLSGQLGMDNLSGPVGVVDTIGEVYEQSRSEGALIVLMNLLNMAILLSANLGVMNLLPFPALDGGRLVFLIIEAVRRKPGNQTIEGAIHFTGFALLMILMVVIMYSDIIKLL